MKVAIAGAFCSGKTTLTADLARAIPSSVAVPDECRPILASIPSIDWTILEVRSYLVVRQVVVESSFDADDLLFVDGGVVNNIAHDRVLLNDPPSRSALLHSLSYRWYDQVLWCDYAEIPLVDDGGRYLDRRLRERLDSAIAAVLEERELPYLRLQGSPEARVDLALSKIGLQR